MHVQCKVRNTFFIYNVVDSTLDHLLALSEDGPGVGMGMVEGSGGVIPTAAVYRNDIYNGKSITKESSNLCTQCLYFNYIGEKIHDPYIYILS